MAKITKKQISFEQTIVSLKVIVENMFGNFPLAFNSGYIYKTNEFIVHDGKVYKSLNNLDGTTIPLDTPNIDTINWSEFVLAPTSGEMLHSVTSNNYQDNAGNVKDALDNIDSNVKSSIDTTNTNLSNSVDAINSTTNALDSRVTTAESSITSNDTAINNKVNALDSEDIAHTGSGSYQGSATNVKDTLNNMDTNIKASIDNVIASTGGAVQTPVQDITALKAIDSYSDKDICLVENNGLYRLDETSGATSDNDFIVTPTTAPLGTERWIKIAGTINDHSLLTNRNGDSAFKHLNAFEFAFLTTHITDLVTAGGADMHFDNSIEKATVITGVSTSADHIAESDIHVTSQEKTDLGNLSTHIADTAIHSKTFIQSSTPSGASTGDVWIVP